MHPKTHGIAPEDRLPPAEFRRQQRLRWYRCPVERSELRALTQRSDARGLVQAVGHLAIWLATGASALYFFQQELWWAFAAALFLHGTVAAFFTAPHHELCHTTVFRTRWLNEFFLRVYSFLGWQNFHIYRFSHTYHHRNTLHPAGDREEVMPEEPSLRPLYLLQLFTVNIAGGYQSRGLVPNVRQFANVALDRFDNPFNYWGRELYEGFPKQRKRAANWARLVLGLHGAVIVLSFAVGEPVLAVIVSGSPFIANWLRYFVGATQHCGLRSNVPDFRKCCRSVALDPVTEFLYWHMNWHLEHHMFAAVPCYNLKKLHRAVREDMPRPRTLVGAWREMRETWKRQRVEPGYAFDTPVPTRAGEARGPDDPLAESMGGLAPKAIA